MLSKFSALLVASLSASSTAQSIARLVPQVLRDRAAAPAGGWALTATVCPNDLDVCGSGWCCPTSLTCVELGGSILSNVCCPSNINCQAAFQAAPYCGDDTWTLWDKSAGGIVKTGYFCCKPGQVGLLDGTCIAEDAVSSPTQEALHLAPGGSVLNTAAASTSTVIVASSGSITTISKTSITPASNTSVVVVASSTPSSSNNTAAASTAAASSSSPLSAITSSSLESSTSSSSSSSTSAPSASPSSTKSAGSAAFESSWSLLLGTVIAGLVVMNLL